jgi:hypothetical protein
MVSIQGLQKEGHVGVLLSLLLLPELLESLFFPFPFPLLLPLPFIAVVSGGIGGGGPLEDTTVPAAVAATVAEDALFLRARRSAPGPPSCPTRSS